MDTVKNQTFPTGVLFNVNGEHTKAKVVNGCVCEYTEQVGVLRQYVKFISRNIKRLILGRQYLQYFHVTLSGCHMRLWVTDGAAIITHQLHHKHFTPDTLCEYSNGITWHVNVNALDQIINGLNAKDSITIRVTDDNDLIINDTIVREIDEIKHPKIPDMFIQYRTKDMVVADSYDINIDYVNKYANVVSAFINGKVELNDMLIAKNIDEDKKIRFVRYDNSDKVFNHGMMLLVMPRIIICASKAVVALK